MSPQFTSRLWALTLALIAFSFVGVADAAPKKTAPTISAFEMEPPDRLAPGAELFFRVQGTPDSRATVRVVGVNRTIILQEVDDGTYEGNYTLRANDRPQGRSMVTALLRKNGLSATSRIQFAAPAPAPVAQAPQAPQQVQIQRFTAARVDKLDPGTELRFAADGTPGQRMSFAIEGVASGIPMREVRPGRYEGVYTVRRGDRLHPGIPIVATIEGAGGMVARAELARRSLVDARAPQIRNVTPRDGDVLPDNTTVTVSGTFDDRGGVGVDPATVRLVVGSRDVTRDANITREYFTYRANLPPGTYAASVTARDMAGNEMRNAWSFQVHSGPIGSGTQYFPLEFTSHQPNATVAAGSRVQVRGRTAPNATVDVEVIGLAPVVGQIGLSHKLLSQRVTADRNGDFVFDFAPPANLPGMRYEVEVKASQGGQSKDNHLVLFAQR